MSVSVTDLKQVSDEVDTTMMTYRRDGFMLRVISRFCIRSGESERIRGFLTILITVIDHVGLVKSSVDHWGGGQKEVRGGMSIDDGLVAYGERALELLCLVCHNRTEDAWAQTVDRFSVSSSTSSSPPSTSSLSKSRPCLLRVAALLPGFVPSLAAFSSPSQYMERFDQVA